MPGPAISNSKSKIKYVLYVGYEVSHAGLSQGSWESAGIVDESLKKDGGWRKADPANHTRALITDDLVAAIDFLAKGSVLINGYVVVAFALDIACRVTFQNIQGVVGISGTGGNTGSSVKISSSWVIKVGVGISFSYRVCGPTYVRLLISGSVDVVGVAFGVAVEGKGDHDSDVDHHEYAAEYVCAVSIVRVLGSVFDALESVGSWRLALVLMTHYLNYHNFQSFS